MTQIADGEIARGESAVVDEARADAEGVAVDERVVLVRQVRGEARQRSRPDRVAGAEEIQVGAGRARDALVQRVEDAVIALGDNRDRVAERLENGECLIGRASVYDKIVEQQRILRENGADRARDLRTAVVRGGHDGKEPGSHWGRIL